MLQCHGDADPMVPFAFGTQTAEKMKSLINPSNITFKPYRGLSHCACPEVSVGAGRGGSPPVFLTHADWFRPFLLCAGNGGYQAVHREAAPAHQGRVKAGVRGRRSPPSDCFWASSEAPWDASVHAFKVTTARRCRRHRGGDDVGLQRAERNLTLSSALT